MAKINKLALTRMAMRMTITEMDQKELLCLLADLFVGNEDKEQPRWFGNGTGTSGLEQGIYSHMTTFRRMSNLWKKITVLNGGDEEKLRQETIRVKDWVLKRLGTKGVDIAEIRVEEPNE